LHLIHFIRVFQARKVTPQPFTYDDSVIEIVIAQAMTVEQLLGRTKVLTKAEGIAHGTVAVTSAPSFFLSCTEF
jgi:hypothetical protein